MHSTTSAQQINGQAKSKVNIKPDTDFNNISENPFPVHVLPGLFGKLIKECNTALNFPVDYMATSILCAAATAVGKSVKIKVKSGWYEFPAFFFALVGDAGANKSHPLDTSFKPYEEMDRKAIQQCEKENREYEEYQSLSKKEKKDNKDLGQKDKPILRKNILHNFSPEVLVQRMVDNPYGCTVVSDELETFLEGMNNYSKVDQSSTFLSFWSNKSTSVDRAGKPVPLWLQVGKIA